jgi:putative phosphoesterase
MTRVAALYDIHGNLPALEAVLAELPRLKVDVIVIGGDAVWGPLPKETLGVLRALPGEAHWVRGNADREVAAADPSAPIDEGDLIQRITHWVAGRLDASERSFLRSLPLTTSVEVDGLGPVLFCHATPRRDDEVVTSLTPEDVAFEMVAGIEEGLVVCGHTHVQFDRTVGELRLVNAGSVGLPYEDEPGAYWTLLGPGVEAKRTPYDLDAAAEQIRAEGAPEVDALISVLREPPDKLEVARQHETRAGRNARST